MNRRSIHGFVSGRVQGVGFRYFVYRHALALELTGYVRNLRDGRVEFLAQGDADNLLCLLERLREGPAHAQVTGLEYEDLDQAPELTGFTTG